jgi:hypothetical protein
MAWTDWHFPCRTTGCLQTGLFEQKEMVQLTGGQCVLIDTFHNVVFKDSLKRMFAKEGEEGFLGMSSHATLEVLPSRDIKVGPLLSSGVYGITGLPGGACICSKCDLLSLLE